MVTVACHCRSAELQFSGTRDMTREWLIVELEGSGMLAALVQLLPAPTSVAGKGMNFAPVTQTYFFA
jgi:hypothetical protein